MTENLIKYTDTEHFIRFSIEGIGFEMSVANQQINTGRHWFVQFFY